MEKGLQLPESQLEIMELIWKKGGTMMFAELAEELERSGKTWKANTILTFLSRLSERGMLQIRKQGRLNEYVALVSENEYLEEQASSFVNNVFRGDARHLMTALLKQDYLSEQDYEDLKAFWNGGNDVI